MTKLKVGDRVIDLHFHYCGPGERALCGLCRKDLGFVLPGKEDFMPHDEIQYCDECMDKEELWRPR